MEDAPKKLRKYYTKLVELRDIYKDSKEEAFEYARPQRARLFSGWDNTTKPKKNYDNRATRNIRIFRDGMISMSLNPSVNFLELTVEPQYMSDVKIKNALKDLERDMYYKLATSKFYDKAAVPIEDWGICGVGILSCEYGPTGNPIYDNHHIAMTTFDVDKNNNVDTVIRELKMSLSEIALVYEETVGEEVLEKAKQNPSSRVTVYHAAIPKRIQRALEIDEVDGWLSIYYTFDLGNSEGTILSFGTFKKFPYKVLRMNHSQLDPYGQGFVEDLIGEIKLMNEIAKTEIELAHINARPPMDIPQERKGKEVLTPGGINYYMDTDRYIRPIYTGSNYQIPDDQYNRRANMLDDYMFATFFQMLAQIQRTMTAFEVQQRLAEKAAQMSPLSEQLHQWLKEITEELAYNILSNDIANRYPEELKNMQVEVAFVSPMARLQKRLFEEQDIRNFLEFVVMVGQFDPSVGQRIRGGIMLDDIKNFYKIKGDYVYSEAEYQKKLKEAQEAQMQMQNAQLENERMRAQAQMVKAQK